MKEIANITKSVADTTQSLPPWLNAAVMEMSFHGRPTIPATRRLTSAQRQTVEAMCSDLEAHFHPGPPKAIAVALARLFTAFPAQQGDVAARARVNTFVDLLADFPAMAVHAAVTRWLRGEDGVGGENYSFPPSPPQLYRLAKRCRQGMEGRLAVLLKVLDAKVVDPPQDDGPYVDPAALKRVTSTIEEVLQEGLDR